MTAWVVGMAGFHYLVTLINTPSTVKSTTDALTGGFAVTIIVAVFTLMFSFPLGVLLALARTSKLPIFRVLSTSYIEVIRGVPLITILFFFTLILNLFLPEGMDISLLAGATLGYTLFSAAYLAENIRGGLQAVRRGQYEASDAVGLSTVQRTMFIVLPQALRVSIPPLVGQVIATFKETSLLAHHRDLRPPAGRQQGHPGKCPVSWAPSARGCCSSASSTGCSPTACQSTASGWRRRLGVGER